MKAAAEVEIFSDGACFGNPGPGGWAAILHHPATGKEIKISGAEVSTTNNRMEMIAVIRALEQLKKPCRVRLVCDSQYVIKGLREWLDSWQRRNWRSSGGGAVKNRDLWERLASLKSTHILEPIWIKGHAGHRENEECDRMAKEEIERL